MPEVRCNSSITVNPTPIKRKNYANVILAITIIHTPIQRKKLCQCNTSYYRIPYTNTTYSVDNCANVILAITGDDDDEVAWWCRHVTCVNREIGPLLYLTVCQSRARHTHRAWINNFNSKRRPYNSFFINDTMQDTSVINVSSFHVCVGVWVCVQAHIENINY